MSRHRRHTPADDVLKALRREAPPMNALQKPVDPWPTAWPFASPMHRPTDFLPLYERKEQ